MQGEKEFFRKRFFGGFNRDDVIKYIAKIADERNDALAAKEKAENESQGLIDAVKEKAERELRVLAGEVNRLNSANEDAEKDLKSIAQERNEAIDAKEKAENKAKSLSEELAKLKGEEPPPADDAVCEDNTDTDESADTEAVNADEPADTCDAGDTDSNVGDTDSSAGENDAAEKNDDGGFKFPWETAASTPDESAEPASAVPEAPPADEAPVVPDAQDVPDAPAPPADESAAQVQAENTAPVQAVEETVKKTIARVKIKRRK